MGSDLLVLRNAIDEVMQLVDHRVLPDEAGALAESLSVAVRAVRRGGIVAGVDVQVFGAGTIGLMTAQVARASGARSVTVRDALSATAKSGTTVALIDCRHK